MLRRLYSTFAGGWPGTGLLLMRLVGGSALLMRATSILSTRPPVNTSIVSACLAASGLLLISGLWTPIAGSVAALIAAGQLMTLSTDRYVLLLLGTIGAALAMLGPGLWSIDARLFGWKRIEAPPRKSRLS